MIIDYAIVSTDQNEMYKDFWPIVKNLWINLIGIKPILVEITDHDEIIIEDDFIIHKIKSVDNIDTGFQSQVARMYITKFYPDNVCLTSDIDMLPLSKHYFTNNISNYNNEQLIIFSSDAYQNINRYPICYNAAKGKLFNDIMKFEDTFEEYCNKLLSFNWGWDTDELYFGKKVNEYQDQHKIVKLKRGWVHGKAINRIDRVYWIYNQIDLKNQNYIDSHSLRPYNDYKNEIDNILNIVL